MLQQGDSQKKKKKKKKKKWHPILNQWEHGT